MRIKLWVQNEDTGEVLEDLGTCLTDNPARAVEMYNQDEAWAKKGYNADIHWKDISHARGTAPDTSLHLGSERRAWLAEQGGIQPTIVKLIDSAR